MTISYYCINDPETVARGITLDPQQRNFSIRIWEDRFDTKDSVVKYLEAANKYVGSDSFANVLPRDSGRYLGNPTSTYTDITEDKGQR